MVDDLPARIRAAKNPEELIDILTNALIEVRETERARIEELRMSVPHRTEQVGSVEQMTPQTYAGRTLERIVRNAMPAADGVRDFIVRIEQEAHALATPPTYLEREFGRASAEGLTPEHITELRRLMGDDPNVVRFTPDADYEIRGLLAALRDTGPRPDSGIDVERLTTVLYDWMPDGADVSVGFDGESRHLTGGDLARYIFDRAAEYARLSTPRESGVKAILTDCDCVPGHRCDCEDLRSLLYRILTSAEYGKMEAEGLAAAGLGLVWSEEEDRYVSSDALKEMRGRASTPRTETPEPQCLCCEDGYYCRHRCPVHPKPNGITDSGRPWFSTPSTEISDDSSESEEIEKQVIEALIELDKFATWSALNRPEYADLRAALDKLYEVRGR